VLPAVQAIPQPSFEATFQIIRGNLRLGTTGLTFIVAGNGHYRFEPHAWPGSGIAWRVKENVRELSQDEYRRELESFSESLQVKRQHG
jgi:hypothetical protein